MSILRTSLVLVPLFLFAGCTGEKPEPTTAPAVDSAVTAKLEKADAQDGTVDKVVSNCAGCQLGMAGMAEHSAKIGEYTLHFCDGCVDKVKNPVPVITQLKLK